MNFWNFEFWNFEQILIKFLAFTFMLSEYTSTVDEDESLLKSDLPIKIRFAVILRLSEKNILLKSIDLLKQKLSEL